MRAFRIALAKYGATAKQASSGLSGFHTDGRWHQSGRHLDYAASNRSLAALERLVHYKRFTLLEPLVLHTLEIPDRMIETVKARPVGWDGPDLLPAAQAYGNKWYDGARSPALLVPSSVTPGELNLLLNSRHPMWSWDWHLGMEPFRLDRRLADLLKKDRAE